MKWPAILPKRQYGDPAKVYAEAEERTCKGCGWIAVHYFQWDSVESCGKGKAFGKRCKDFTEKKGHA